MKILLALLIIFSSNIYAQGECLSTVNINNTNIIYNTEKELEYIRLEYQEYLENIKQLPRTSKFGKSGKKDHIKQRKESYEYAIALKYQQLEQYKYIAAKDRKIIVIKQ